jgi:transposase
LISVGFGRLRVGYRKLGTTSIDRILEITDRPELADAVTPLLNARVAIEQQIADLDRKVMRFARNIAQVKHFITAPGIGPVTACFLATIRRFRKSTSVRSLCRINNPSVRIRRNRLDSAGTRRCAAISAKQPTYCLLT